MSWLSKGFDAAETQVASNTGNWTKEFFLKSGEEATDIRILDDESTNIRAHFVKGKGWFTCIRDIEDSCPLCDVAGTPGSPVGKAQNQFVFNVFDPREYVDKKGESHKNQVKVWRMGITLLRVLNKKKAKYGPYTGWILEISKMGSGQSTAWNIEVERDTDKFVLPDGEEPYVLEEVLAPKTKAELLAIANGNSSASADFDSTEDDDDDSSVSWRKG